MLYYTVLTLLESGHEAVYTIIERPLQFAQIAAIMEVCCFFFPYLLFLLLFHLVVYFSSCCRNKIVSLTQLEVFV